MMNILELAKQAGWIEEAGEPEFGCFNLEAFADLVRADEREACAKVCEHQPHWRACAAAIRARGDT